MLTTRDGPAVIDVKARYWSKIAILLELGGLCRNIAITFAMEKLQWCGYPMVKKLKTCLFVSTEYTNVTDRHRTTA